MGIVRQAWNGEAFVQVKIYVKPETAAAFKAKCVKNGVSMASRLSGLMAEDTGQKVLRGVPADALLTRSQRRKAVKNMISQLYKILAMEIRYMDNIPENLQNSAVYERAEESVATLEEAIDSLNAAY